MLEGVCDFVTRAEPLTLGDALDERLAGAEADLRGDDVDERLIEAELEDVRDIYDVGVGAAERVCLEDALLVLDDLTDALDVVDDDAVLLILVLLDDVLETVVVREELGDPDEVLLAVALDE